MFFGQHSNVTRLAAVGATLALFVALSSAAGCDGAPSDDGDYVCDACEAMTGPPPQPMEACTAATDCMALAAKSYEATCTCRYDGDIDPIETAGCVSYGAPQCMSGQCVWPQTLEPEHGC